LEKAKLNGFEKTFIVKGFNKDQLPLKDQSYEFVFCKDVLEHLLDPMFFPFARLIK